MDAFYSLMHLPFTVTVVISNIESAKHQPTIITDVHREMCHMYITCVTHI